MEQPLNSLSATEIAAGIARGDFSAEAVMRACLARIEAREAEVGAFIHLDAEKALAAARAADAGPAGGPLHGVPFAIKDIIDTADFPTGWGSPIYEGFQPPRNASCVELFLQAGAVPLGKTVTTEFAYFNPGKTANPRNPGHTSGGSSSGSAAAVADEMVPLGFGSQTAGSLIRPAAYCGILGYKPSLGAYDLQGVMGLSPSLDTLGLLARRVEDLALAGAVLTREPAALGDDFAEEAPRIALMRGPHWWEGSLEMRDVCQRALDTLAGQGAETGEQAHPEVFAELTECQKVIMAFETARARVFEFHRHRDGISEAFAGLVEGGLAISREAYDEARRITALALRAMDTLFTDIDVILAPAAPGEAPAGLGATGDPLFNRAWTLLGMPCISIPFGSGPQGLPLSVQLVGRRGADRRLLAAARWVQQHLAGDVG